MSFGDFKTLERDMNLNEVTVPTDKNFFDDFSLNDVTKTANDWLGNLGKTYLNIKSLETAIKTGGTAENEQLQRDYEQTMQGTPSKGSSSFKLEQKHFIYGGVALAAYMILKA